jgi:hypothetical protein
MLRAGGFQDSSVRLYCMDARLQEASARRRKRPRERTDRGFPGEDPQAQVTP